jgi:ubiquinone/menaquinone biosynthesis C-methylase UbiE
MGRELSVPQLFQMGYYWEAKIFLTSVRLDLYTPLAAGPKTGEEIARTVGADPAFLVRLLDALVTIGLLKREGERYANTPVVQEFLVKGSPFYAGELMLLQDDEWSYWGHLEEIVRTGRPTVSENVFMSRPEVGANILRVLHRMAMRNAPSIVKAVNLSGCRTLLDVGGGAGTFSIHFCKANPDLSVTLFDLPGSLPVAEKNVAEFGLSDRFRFIAGNFKTDPISGPFDAIFLSDILHYQTFDENQALFEKLHGALAPGGLIVVKDMFVNDDPGNPGWNAIFSIHLMVYTEKGRCFKVDDLRAWLAKSGFENIQELERSTLLTARKKE